MVCLLLLSVRAVQSGGSRSATTCSTHTRWSRTCARGRCTCAAPCKARHAAGAHLVLARASLLATRGSCATLPPASPPHPPLQETSDVGGVMDGDLTPFMKAWLKHKGQQQSSAATAAAGAAAS